MAHMLAELLDNATSYSPPETEVWVTGQPMPTASCCRSSTRASGCPSSACEQINAHLAAPAPVELVGVRAMGLMVVSRLAARHGIRVELRSGPQGGTAAEVTIPSARLTFVARHAPIAHTIGVRWRAGPRRRPAAR